MTFPIEMWESISGWWEYNKYREFPLVIKMFGHPLRVTSVVCVKNTVHVEFIRDTPCDSCGENSLATSYERMDTP